MLIFSINRGGVAFLFFTCFRRIIVLVLLRLLRLFRMDLKWFIIILGFSSCSGMRIRVVRMRFFVVLIDFNFSVLVVVSLVILDNILHIHYSVGISVHYSFFGLVFSLGIGHCSQSEDGKSNKYLIHGK
jgi:hypothetical protein